MICICKCRLPGCDRNKHSEIFSAVKPFLQRETLGFVWVLAGLSFRVCPRSWQGCPSVCAPAVTSQGCCPLACRCQPSLPAIATTTHLPFLPPAPALAPGEGDVSCQERGDRTLGPGRTSQKSREGRDTSPLGPVRVLVISHWSAKPSPHASSLGSLFGGGWPQEVLGANCPEITHGESQPLALESGFPTLRRQGKHPVDGNNHIHSSVPQFGVGSKGDAWAASLWRVLPCALSPGLKSPGWFCSYEQRLPQEGALA